jgi:hypothetical protein
LRNGAPMRRNSMGHRWSYGTISIKFLMLSSIQ